MYFAEEFPSFTLNMFGALSGDTRLQLRDMLREKRVHVERKRGVLTRDALFVAAPKAPEWPNDKIAADLTIENNLHDTNTYFAPQLFLNMSSVKLREQEQNPEVSVQFGEN